MLPLASMSVQLEVVPSPLVPLARRVSDRSNYSDGSANAAEPEAEECTPDTLEEREAWEEELDKVVQRSPAEIKSWDVLRAQIKAHLKKNSRKLPLSQINQLIILSNFATL